MLSLQIGINNMETEIDQISRRNTYYVKNIETLFKNNNKKSCWSITIQRNFEAPWVHREGEERNKPNFLDNYSQQRFKFGNIVSCFIHA